MWANLCRKRVFLFAYTLNNNFMSDKSVFFVLKSNRDTQYPLTLWFAVWTS